MHNYFERYNAWPVLIGSPAPVDLGLVVVIPCHDESDILGSLESLYQNLPTTSPVEIIVVINHSENASESIKTRNENSAQEILGAEHPINTYIIRAYDLPAKHAGVGWARKIGMDEACRRLGDNDGVLICFDADCTCSKNLLQSIDQHFKDPIVNGAAIRYEHPMDHTGIVLYELFLRYYNCGLRYAGLPYAYHTVGSSMAVRASAYMKQGGMNRRKAGEDFYFLHKIIALGNFVEINDCAVYPSSRVSGRVPFGTGKAMGKFAEDPESLYMSYDHRCFQEIKNLVELLPELYEQGQTQAKSALITFLEQQGLNDKLKEIKAQTTSFERFEKRFYAWFDAFLCLKFVHHHRDQVSPNKPILEEAQLLFKELTGEKVELNAEQLLEAYRQFEKKQSPDS